MVDDKNIFDSQSNDESLDSANSAEGGFSVDDCSRRHCDKESPARYRHRPTVAPVTIAKVTKVRKAYDSVSIIVQKYSKHLTSVQGRDFILTSNFSRICNGNRAMESRPWPR